MQPLLGVIDPDAGLADVGDPIKVLVLRGNHHGPMTVPHEKLRSYKHGFVQG